MSEWDWKPHLKKDEKIEWQGKPKLEVNPNVKRWPRYLFFWGIICALIAICWPMANSRIIGYIFFGVAAAGMLGLGIYLSIRAPNTLRHMHYAITNQRALIEVAGAVNAVDLNKNPTVKTTTKGDLSTIEFRHAKTQEENHITKYPEMANLTKSDADKILALLAARDK